MKWVFWQNADEQQQNLLSPHLLSLSEARRAVESSLNLEALSPMQLHSLSSNSH